MGYKTIAANIILIILYIIILTSYKPMIEDKVKQLNEDLDYKKPPNYTDICLSKNINSCIAEYTNFRKVNS